MRGALEGSSHLLAGVYASPPNDSHVQRTAWVLTVVNQKGGVGKTTTAVNLAVGLAQVGEPTLLVDADPQANATSGLGIDPRSRSLNLFTLIQQATEHASIVPQSPPNWRQGVLIFI